VSSIADLSSLRGRTALVTGAAGSLGAAVVGALRELGADVACADLPGAQLHATVERIAGDGAHCRAFPIDLSDTGAVQSLPQQVHAAFGTLNIVVNCAAMVGTAGTAGWAVPLEQQEVQPFQRALDINLTAPFVLTQAAVPLLRRAPGATVINIASIYGVTGPDWRLYEGTELGNPAAYAASKGGLLQLTRWLATTLAPDIRVNAVSPGGIFRGHSDPFLSAYIQRTPLRRMATTDDIIGAVVYLASDLSSYVTGQNLIVDGGWTAW
jgi:NAD(P)-dependent dehydrogenase (short-subunit alcohol dehydrogenase family)